MLALVVVLGSLRFADPFSGDQALFFVAAEKLHAGGVLYRDFWDIKQPLIFAFFLVAGTLCGFTQTGLHVADLGWQIVFSIALVFGLREELVDRRWAAFAPVAIVGAYLTGSSSWHLLQVEELVGLPLFCVGWFAVQAGRSPRHARLFAGLCGAAAGVAILFKLLFACIVVAIACAVAADAWRAASNRVRFECLLAWCVGLAIPLGFFACYVAAYGLGAEVFRTFFVLPLTIDTSQAHAPLSRLADSALRFVLYFRGIIFLAIVGVVLARDERSRLWRRIAYAWLGAAAVVILVQTQSWWQYHFGLLLPPIGILATFGIATLARRVRTTGRVGFAWLALCGVAAYIAVPLPQAAIQTAARIATDRPYASAAALDRYRSAESSEYAQAERDAAFVAKTNDAGDFFVFGNPLVYLLAGRGQALGMNGWALQLYTRALWHRVDEEMLARAPSLVFVLEPYAIGMMNAHSPETARLLATRYTLVARTSDGVWLQRK